MGELSLRRAAGALGAFVGGVGLADVAASDQLYAQVRHALNEHEVLFFREHRNLRMFRRIHCDFQGSFICPPHTLQSSSGNQALVCLGFP